MTARASSSPQGIEDLIAKMKHRYDQSAGVSDYMFLPREWVADALAALALGSPSSGEGQKTKNARGEDSQYDRPFATASTAGDGSDQA